MESMGYKEYQDFIDFTIILKNYYGVEKNKELSQGAFVRKLFENICDADIDTCISGNEDTLSRYLRDRSIYGKSANKKLLASVNKRKFEKWIHNKNMAAASLELLLRNIKVFVNNHPARFEKENKKNYSLFVKSKPPVNSSLKFWLIFYLCPTKTPINKIKNHLPPFGK